MTKIIGNKVGYIFGFFTAVVAVATTGTLVYQFGKMEGRTEAWIVIRNMLERKLAEKDSVIE